MEKDVIMLKNIAKTRTGVRQTRPLVHCITNPIAITACANAILAVGASPMMAEHPKEVAQITATAGALVLNLGNITDVRLESIPIAAQSAAQHHVPFVLDAVGVACSDLRRAFVGEFLFRYTPAVIKGNYSEIAALASADYAAVGVDADGTLTEEAMARIAAELAQKYGATVLASGAVDIITDGQHLAQVKNGTPQLAAVTGTGCMQGALCGAYLAAADGFTAAVTAAAVLGICGELARTERGSGSFMVNLMDALSTLSDEDIAQLLHMEVYDLEEL